MCLEAISFLRSYALWQMFFLSKEMSKNLVLSWGNLTWNIKNVMYGSKKTVGRLNSKNLYSQKNLFFVLLHLPLHLGYEKKIIKGFIKISNNFMYVSDSKFHVCMQKCDRFASWLSNESTLTTYMKLLQWVLSRANYLFLSRLPFVTI